MSQQSSHKPGIRYADYENGITHISGDVVLTERKQAEELDTKRSRICFHRGSADALHEMMITFHRDTYVRPHKHLSKTESYLVIDGEIELVYFDDNGVVKKRVDMGNYTSGKDFYLKSVSDEWHTVLIKSEFATILEVTNGPFVADECVFASWAPEVSDKSAADAYMQKLLQR